MGKPIYVELAATLQQEISAGRYPVGSTLPPETALCAMHGISRFTARAALASLQRQGYVARKPRVGSVVLARDPQEIYSVQTNSATDLLRISSMAELHLVSVQDVSADAALARELGCEAGESWIKVATYRDSPDTKMAGSWTDYYLRPEHRGIVPLIGSKRGTVWQFLTELQQRPIERIDQTVEVSRIPKDAALILGVPPRSPALRAIYRMHSAGSENRFYVAITLFPEGRFRLSQTLRTER